MCIADELLVDVNLVLLVVVALVKTDSGNERIKQWIQELCTEVILSWVLIEQGQRFQTIDRLSIGCSNNWTVLNVTIQICIRCGKERCDISR